MIEVGRVCVKIAGRDAGKHCIIIDVVDDNYVIIDGLTRRRKCNIKHLEPLETLLKINKNCEHKTVISELERLGVKMPKEKKSFGKAKGAEKKENAGRPVRKKKVGEKKPQEKKEGERKQEVKKKEDRKKTEDNKK